MTRHKIVVIGASAGGLYAVQEIVSKLPADFAASVFIVIHMSPRSSGALPEILNRAGPLQVSHARHGEQVRAGHIYVAPPDRHMLLDNSLVKVVRGPVENGFRPAVDPLFRTAALAYGSRVVGVILSGGLDDGTVGLSMIKRCGGTAIVQEPEEAVVRSMPESAIVNVEVDHVLPAAEIAGKLVRLVQNSYGSGKPKMNKKANNLGPDPVDMNMKGLAEREMPQPPSRFTCPECGGTLWEFDSGGFLHYRCHVGHGFTAESLMAEQLGEIEAALWSAVRALAENAGLSRRMAAKAREGNLIGLAESYEDRANAADHQAASIRELLQNGLRPELHASRGRQPARARRRRTPTKKVM
jgi:two-component system chemotaxis response regulator CheB